MSDRDRPALDDREYCDGEHEYEQVGVIEWKTGSPELDERFETVVHDCTRCDGRRWSREQKSSSLAEWGAA